MALFLEVKWVEKSDQPEPHQRIKRIGGRSMRLLWEYTQKQAIEGIEGGQFYFYVAKDGRTLKVEVGQTPESQKYLMVRYQGAESQILLDLPEFPNGESVRSTAR